MIQEKTIVCGTREEVMDYLTKKYNFVKRTAETDISQEELNYDGIEAAPSSTSGSIKEQLDSLTNPAGMICWLKKDKTDNSKGYPEVSLSVETLWVFIRDSNNIPL